MSEYRISRDGHYMPTINAAAAGEPLVLNWPDNTPNTCIMSKDLMVEWVAQINAGRTARERISTLEALTDQLAEGLDEMDRRVRVLGYGWATEGVAATALRAYEADKEAHR